MTQYADNERVFQRNCPHCDADLTEVGVVGMQAVDFRAFPFESNLRYEDSWEVHNWDFYGAIIECGNCGGELGRTGPFVKDETDCGVES